MPTPQEREDAAARMAWVISREDWPLLSEERRGLYLSCVDEICEALQLPHGSERETKLTAVMKRLDA